MRWEQVWYRRHQWSRWEKGERKWARPSNAIRKQKLVRVGLLLDDRFPRMEGSLRFAYFACSDAYEQLAHGSSSHTLGPGKKRPRSSAENAQDGSACMGPWNLYFCLTPVDTSAFVFSQQFYITLSVFIYKDNKYLFCSRIFAKIYFLRNFTDLLLIINSSTKSFIK
jgi:hypothetical protein